MYGDVAAAVASRRRRLLEAAGAEGLSLLIDLRFTDKKGAAEGRKEGGRKESVE